MERINERKNVCNIYGFKAQNIGWLQQERKTTQEWLATYMIFCVKAVSKS